MADIYYILVDHEPIPISDPKEWELWIKTNDRTVKHTVIDEAITVTTMFLGVDGSFGIGTPQLFESEVFGGESDGATDRYATWDEAKKGHESLVQLVLNNRNFLI